MRIAFNGWFWNRPDTGSGQYTRQLIYTLAEIAPYLTLMLIVPEGRDLDGVPESVVVERVTLKGGGNRAKVWFEQQAAPKTAERLVADILHVPYWGSPLRSPIPVVVTIHDLIPMIIPQYRGGILARLYTGTVAAAAQGAAAIITDSVASQLDILKNLHVKPEQVFVIPLAAGSEFEPSPGSMVDKAVQEKYKLPPEFVLYLGGYDVRKNIGRLLEAIAYVTEGYDIPLVLAGKMPDKQTERFFDVPSLIVELGLEDSVQAIGWIEEKDKPSLYRLASVFVFPSWYEGFGLPLLEAMACGTPVVGCDVSSIPEVVGDAGFLVEPDDVRHLAGAILGILVQEELARDMRKRVLRQALKFSWLRTAELTLDVYRGVIAQNDGGR